MSSNTGSVDLESVLNIRRRTLAAIGEKALPLHQYRYTDTIYLKREDESNSILSINSKIVIFGELQLLCGIFERYTSNLIVYEESAGSNLKKNSFSATEEEDEDITAEDDDVLPVISTFRQVSVTTPHSPLSSATLDSPPRRKKMHAIGRSQTVASTASEYSVQNLEGKRYGCIELPNMTIIEIIEIFLRNGLELVDVSSNYDKKNVLHQNFVFSKTRQVVQKTGPYYSRSSSFVGT